MNTQHLTNDLLREIATADDGLKAEAIRLFRGELNPPASKPSNPSPSGPLLITVADAATLLGVSRCSIWRIIRAGRLKKIELYPGFDRLRRADVEAFAGGVS